MANKPVWVLIDELAYLRECYTARLSDIGTALEQIERPQRFTLEGLIHHSKSQKEIVIEGRNSLQQNTREIIDLQAKITNLENQLRKHPDFGSLNFNL